MRAALTILLPALLLGVLSACGSEDEAPPPLPDTRPPPAVLSPLEAAPIRRIDPLPPAAPTQEERIGFAIGLLETGGLDEVRWAGEALGREGAPAVEPLATRMTERLAANPALARNILQVFSGPLPAPGAVDRIAAVLNGPADGLDREVAAALGRTGSPAAAPVLARLAGHPDLFTAAAAIRAMDGLPPSAAAAALREAWPDRVNPGARVDALLAMAGGLPEAEALAMLRDAARGSETALAVAAAAELLRRGDAEGGEILRAKIELGGPLPLVLRGLAALAEAGDRFALPRLLDLTADPAGAALLPGAALLGRFDVPEVRARLEALTGPGPVEVRAEALFGLASLDGAAGLDRVRGFLGSERQEDRYLGALVAARIGGPAAASAVADALAREGDRGARIKLLNALALLREPVGATAALDLLAAETENEPGKAEIALNAAAALRAMRELPPAAVDRLTGLVRDGGDGIRFHGVSALARHGKGPEAAKAILGVIESDREDLRMAGARAWLEFPEATPDPLLDVASRDRSRRRSETLVGYARMIRNRP